MNAKLDVLIPNFGRPAALAVTLTSLCAQTYKGFNLIVSDQTESDDPLSAGEVQAAIRVLQIHGHQVLQLKHLPRRGLAEHRQFLLEQSSAPHVLYLDNDLILEADVLERLLQAMDEEKCGFVGAAVVGLSYLGDLRPHQQDIEFWEGPVTPEHIRPNTKEWARHRLHNAANLYHVQKQLCISSKQPRKYRVAWVGGCVLFDAEKLRAVDAFNFWRELPREHCGEDVLAQLRVMARYGGCGIIPSGVYHLELPTTVAQRKVDAPHVLSVDPFDNLRR